MSKHEKNWRIKKLKFINVFFLILIIFCFAFFSFYSNVTNIIFAKNKIDIFKEDLNQIAFYFWNIDKNFSKFLVTLDEIIKSYNRWENIFKTENTQIDFCRNYIKENKDYLKKLWFSEYDELMSLISDLQIYKNELFNLMWKNEAFNYLVILQNTNEKRPNWWFFGSFAFIKIYQWHIQNLEIVDSYYPDFIAYKTRILAPDWTSVFLPDRKIWFIAWNKFWFTDIDGKNLKDLYETMFSKTYEMRKVQKTMQADLYNKLLNQNIKWVIFIRSDLLEQIIPGLTKKFRERQFLNASVDLIRWEIRGNKKEKYIQEIKDFFSAQKINIIKNIVNNFWNITKQQFVNIYLSNASPKFNWLLIKHKLINIFQTGNIYARDTNTSYNKIDWFVTKNIQIIDKDWNIKIDTNDDILNIQNLETWTYTMRIYYTLNIPEYYVNFIQQLEEKYKIKITDRELAILAIKPWTYDEPWIWDVKKRWETKSTIYFPKNIKVLKAEWDIYYQAPFYATFANWLFYQMWITTNNTSKFINIKFQLE